DATTLPWIMSGRPPTYFSILSASSKNILPQKTSFRTIKPTLGSIGAVADVKDRLYSFTPLRKTSNYFGAFER
nr:hypothetical protein [Tanacetum cinerariifolium]